ncbi:MAG: hypothetical protein LC732_04135 [Acidobacteria bacterium]|nr:hypothetical protein [Acidobacteriota bacterium]
MRNTLAIALVTVALFACSPAEEPAERRSEATIEREAEAGNYGDKVVAAKRRAEEIAAEQDRKTAETNAAMDATQ